MKTARWMAIVLPVLALLVVPAFATAEGWGLPSLNPFKSDEKPTKASESSWKSAKKTDSAFASKSSTEPSMWSKMTSSTSSAMKKTTATLTPWKKTKKAPARVTGSRTAHKPAAPASKTTWYNPGTWFSSKEKAAPEPQQKVGSVSEFLNQKRVPY